MRISGLIGLALIYSVTAAASEAPTYRAQSYAVKHAKGLKRTEKSKQFLVQAPRRSYIKDATPIPAATSLRTYAGPVEDQGQCGSCWDFSLTEVLRGTLMTAGKDPGRLSFNYLLNCAKTMQGCNGGDFPAADYFINPQGAPAYGTDGVYTATDGKCQSAPAVASTVSYSILGDDFGTVPNAVAPSFKDIAYVVGVLHQPVSIDIAADDNFASYVSGVYNGCSSEDPDTIDHMVVIEGYDCESAVDADGNCTFDAKGGLPNGVGTWLVKNSWGESWGDNGYITMKATDSKGLKCNSVATDALFYTVQ